MAHWSTSSSSSTPAPPTRRRPSPGRRVPASSTVTRSCPTCRRCPARARRCGARLPRPPATSSSSSTPTCWPSASDYVTGLLGPLLTDPRSHFVKAMYDRPLADGARGPPGGGGRVTELVARPLLNLHWPQLAGFVQPLAGEYAARRPLLERLPFATGYGVELALLIDALDAVGPRRAGPGRPRRTTAPSPRRPAARPDGRRDLADGARPAAPGRRPAGRRADVDAVRARRVRLPAGHPRRHRARAATAAQRWSATSRLHGR